MDKRVSLNVRGYLGTAPHRAAPSPSALVWWLGPTFLFREPLLPVQLSVMAQRGPRYTGTFATNRSHDALVEDGTHARPYGCPCVSLPSLLSPPFAASIPLFVVTY